MKNSIITTIITLIALQVNAQIVPLEQEVNYTRSLISRSGLYFKDVNGVLDKFLGNWKYQSATDMVEITISKDNHRIISDHYLDDIYIEFRYTQNGSIILDTYQQDKHYLIRGGFFKDQTNTNKIYLSYLEPNQIRGKCYQYLNLEYLANGSGQPLLNWNAFSEPASMYYNDPVMPLTMVFIKQP